MGARVTWQQSSVAFAGLSVFVLMVAHGMPWFASIVTILCLGGVLWGQLKRLKKVWPDAWSSLRERITSLSNSIKPFYEVTPIVACVEAICLMLALATVLMWFAFGPREATPYMKQLVTGIFFLAGTLECVLRCSRLARHAWTRTLGKILLTGIGATVLLLATATSRHFVFQTTQVDPKYFPSFVGLLALALTPLFYVYALGLLAALWSFIECIGLVLALGILEVTQFARAYSNDIRGALSLLRNQAYTAPHSSPQVGKEFGGGTLMTNFARSFVFLGFITGVLFGCVKILQSPGDQVIRALKIALVELEYNELRQCGSSQSTLSVPLEPNQYSVAKPSNLDVSFHTLTCPTKR